MNDRLPLNPGADADDQDKAHTPDKHRNDKARWKERDMPDQAEDPGVGPEDYERPDGSGRS